MGATAIGIAQEEDEEQGIDEQDIFDGVVFFGAVPLSRETSVLLIFD